MERFWSKVNRGGSGECWLWTACTFTHTGYGCFGLRGKNLGAHRVAWALTNGDIPEGVCVCHKCDVKPCCNPGHLFLGTPKENSVDMAQKGRGGRPLKLDGPRVVELRRAGLTQCAIADLLGVTQAAVSFFLCGKRRDKPDNDVLLRSA
jgi:hypothetical protein